MKNHSLKGGKPSLSTLKRMVNEMAEALAAVPTEGYGDNNAVALQVVIPAAALDRLQALAKTHGYFAGSVSLFIQDRLVQLSDAANDALLPAPVPWRKRPPDLAARDESPEEQARAAIRQSAAARAEQRREKRQQLQLVGA